MKPVLIAVLALLSLGACKEDRPAQIITPVALTEDAVGHFCQMALLEHPGPKAQVHLAGYPAPLWFSQVRDGVAFLKSPERPAEVLATYVSDMAQAPSWDEPGAENWIRAEDAFYVVGADVAGGMGAPELAPFGTEADAAGFAAQHGGTVMRLDAIPDASVLAPVERLEG